MNMKFNWVALWEAIKEPLRWLVLAIIPFGIAYFTELGYEWAGLLVLILRVIDKYLHEVGKEQTTEKVESPLLKGLTRF
jgi:hypothetical protein